MPKRERERETKDKVTEKNTEKLHKQSVHSDRYSETNNLRYPQMYFLLVIVNDN